MGSRSKARKEIDIVALEKLGRLHCTLEEVAAYFDCSIATLVRRLGQDKYREAYDRGKARGKITLRRIQLKLARAGNPTMGIWLGKQLLGQRDVQEIEVGPKHAISTDENLKALSTQELQEYYRLRRKMDTANTAATAATSPAAVSDVSAPRRAREVVLDVTKLQ